MLICSCGSVDLSTVYNENENPKKKIKCNKCYSIITIYKDLTCSSCNSTKIKRVISHSGITLRCTECQADVIPMATSGNELGDNNITDKDVVKSNIIMARQTQRFQDSLRMIRKSNREKNRDENILIDYLESIESAITSYPKPKTIQHEIVEESCNLIVHLTDLHINEVINNQDNSYNIKIASQRLYKFLTKICKYLQTDNFENVYVVMTGDLINSDVRRDKLIQNATSNGNATLIAYQLIAQFIEELNKYANVKVTSVSGNESRLSIEKTFNNVTHSNNMDFTVFQYLKLHYRDCIGISFIDPIGYDNILNIDGFNVVLVHGDNNGTHSDKNIMQYYNKIAKSYNIFPDLILCGHFHSTQIGDVWCRGGSLCGSDDYAVNALSLSGRASQNIYKVYKNKDYDCIRIDLQNINNDDKQFNYTEELEVWE